MNHREKGGSLKNIIHWATHARFVEIFLRFLHGSFLTRLDDLHFGHSNLFRISYFSAKAEFRLTGTCFGFGCCHAALCSLCEPCLKAGPVVSMDVHE